MPHAARIRFATLALASAAALVLAGTPLQAAGKKKPHTGHSTNAVSRGHAPDKAAGKRTRQARQEWTQPTNGVWSDGCPPGLSAKTPACLPPGQAHRK
jgi:hypothetical protein